MLVQYKVGYLVLFLNTSSHDPSCASDSLVFELLLPMARISHVCISMLCYTNATSSRCWLSAGDGSHGLSCAGQALCHWTTFSAMQMQYFKIFLSYVCGACR